MKIDKILRIGGASGYWGDAARATPQLLNSPGLDYIVYDYLAEITMSIMARARATDESKGYAVDFISAAMQPNLGLVAERGIKVISKCRRGESRGLRRRPARGHCRTELPVWSLQLRNRQIIARAR